MQYKRPIVLDIFTWLHSLLLFGVLYPLFASLLLLKDASFWRTTTAGLLLLIPIFLSWFLMQRIHNFILYLLSGVIVSAICGLIALCWGGIGRPEGLLCGILTVVCSVIIFAVRTHAKVTYGQKKEEFLDVHGDKTEFPLQEREMPNLLSQPLAYHWVWFTLLYVPGMLLHFTTYLYLAFSALLADIFLCLGFSYISSLYEYIRKNQSVSNLPVSSMSRIHRTSGIIGALLLVLFLLPAILYGREFEPDLTTDKPLLTSEETTEEKSFETYAPEMADTQLIASVDHSVQPSKWIPILMRIIGFVFSAVIIISVILLFIRKVRSLGHDFAVEEDDEAVFLEPETADASGFLFRRKHRESRLSVNQQIRRRYRKTIRKATKGQPSKWATPSELERDAELTDDKATQTLHVVYEKARYSREGCNHEDLDQL